MAELLDDKLSRKNEAKFLINYLTKRYEVKNNEDSFVLNVNAKWGYGKTFFLKLLEEELKKKEHEVIFFDAWKNDFTKEPLLAFFSEINDSLSDYFNNSKNSEAKRIFKLTFSKSLPLFVSILTKHLTGLSAEEFTQLLSEEDVKSDDEEKSEIKKDTQNTLSSIMSKATEIALQEHKTLKNSIETFKKNMKLLITQIEKDTNPKLPLFILIDELDRCRPNYAIELLENIKHIFDIKGIYFIIATNSKQLSHSINAIYGANFSSEIYLKRFFDQEYSLKEPDKYEYIEFLFEKELINEELLYTPLSQEDYKNKNLNLILIQIYSKYFNLSLRDIKQVIDLLATITLTWEDEEEIHLQYLLFFIITKQKYPDIFNKHKKGIKRGQIRDDLINESFNQKNIDLISILELYSQIINCNSKDSYEREEKISSFRKGLKDESYKITTKFYMDSNKINKLLEYSEIVESAAQLK